MVGTWVWSTNFCPPTIPGVGGSREGYQQSKWSDMLPDLHHTVEKIAAEGDTVWVRYTVSGTHTGDGLLCIPATGRRVSFSNACIYTIRGTKIVRIWGLVDRFSFLQQLGVAPTMEEMIERARGGEG